MWQRIKNVYHLCNAFLANVWYGFPSRKLTVIGVTGTDGKTTTVSLIYHILYTAGHNASMISSVGAVIGGKEYDVGFHVTTPSPWALQRFIKKAASVARDSVAPSSHPMSSVASSLRALDGTPSSRTTPRSKNAKAPSTFNYLVLETTSHAIDQNRIWGITFDIGVLTNVTHEHLDYHKTYENYVKTKTKLLNIAKVAVVNRDENSFTLVKSEIRNPKSEINSKPQFKTQKFITYGLNSNSDINPKNFSFKTKLIGEFNRYNILAAIAACRELGIDDKTLREAIESFEAPIGRGEIVYKNSFTVMIDFAHTPNAFDKILSSIRPEVKGKLIHVFGSAGERDASKRPLMGKISAKYADIIVLTAEDPRSESVDKIIREIELGVMNQESRIKDGRLFKIPDRQEAITTAIKMAKKGDFVLITGKSHEKSMNYGNGEEPWDEFGAVREALGI